MTVKELAASFGVAASTASATQKLLKIDYSQAECRLPSIATSNPMLWMASINGYLLDARTLPLEMQKICYERGLIPYIRLIEMRGTTDLEAHGCIVCI